MPEQFTLNEFTRDGGAVDLDKRHGAPVALLVQVARHKLLARTVRPGDQHPCISRRHLVYHLPDALHRGGLSYHVGTVDFLFEHLVLAGESLALGSVLDGDQDTVEIKRLLHEVESPFLDALHCRVYVAMAGDHHHGGIDPHLHEFVKHFDAVHSRHLDVAEYHIKLFFLDFAYRIRPVLSGVGIIPLIGEDLFERVADSSLVINYKYSHFFIIT